MPGVGTKRMAAFPCLTPHLLHLWLAGKWWSRSVHFSPTDPTPGPCELRSSLLQHHLLDTFRVKGMPTSQLGCIHFAKNHRGKWHICSPHSWSGDPRKSPRKADLYSWGLSSTAAACCASLVQKGWQSRTTHVVWQPASG